MLRAKGGNSRTCEATTEEQSDGEQTFRVTVRDPDGADDDQQRVRALYGEPHPVRTVEAANAAVNAYERYARARGGEAPDEPALELRAAETLRADGERGRRYQAEWIPTRGEGERLHVTVTNPSMREEEDKEREQVLFGQAATGSCGPSSRRTRRSTSTSEPPPGNRSRPWRGGSRCGPEETPASAYRIGRHRLLAVLDHEREVFHRG